MAWACIVVWVCIGVLALAYIWVLVCTEVLACTEVWACIVVLVCMKAFLEGCKVLEFASWVPHILVLVGTHIDPLLVDKMIGQVLEEIHIHHYSPEVLDMRTEVEPLVIHTDHLLLGMIELEPVVIHIHHGFLLAHGNLVSSLVHDMMVLAGGKRA